MYVTVLRQPVERLISSYNYFCLNGMEGRKKWTKDMKTAGKCRDTILEWFDRYPDEYSKISTLLCRSSFTTDQAACQYEITRQNLFHPCMKYLLATDLNDGMRRLHHISKRAFPEPKVKEYNKLAKDKSPFLKEQLADASVMSQLNSNAAVDIRSILYNLYTYKLNNLLITF